MKKKVWLIAVALMSLPLLDGDAIANGTRKFGEEVDCDIRFDNTLQQFVASGALGTVRSEPSTHSEKSIGCSVEAYPGHSMVTCEALSDTSSVPQLTCTSEDPFLIAIVGSMNSDSFITFFTPTLTSANRGVCSQINVENNSMYNVKSP
jgi:hypothetical protein